MTKPKTIASDPWQKHVGTNNKAAAGKPSAKKKAAPRKRANAKAKATRRKDVPARQAAAVTSSVPVGKVQLSLRFDPVLLERVRNACHAENRSLQGLVDQALTREVERMEKTHGGPCPPRPGTLKTGPRAG